MWEFDEIVMVLVTSGKKNIMSLLSFLAVIARCHLERGPTTTELLWETENKEQSRFRESWGPLPQYLVRDSHNKWS
jgi:hypothetical protein